MAIDRDSLRLTLAVIGAFVIAGIYIWGRYKQTLLNFLERGADFGDLEFDRPGGAESHGDAAGDAGAVEPVPDEIRPESRDAAKGKVRKEPRFYDEPDGADAAPEPPETAPAPAPVEPPERAPALGAPFVIQISIVAGDDEVFSGEDLRDALMDLKLIHGAMGIFHRYDREYRETLFSVANLVKPGTFPIDEMDSFETPGIAMFFQPAQVDDPVAVFDDLIRTSHELANRLGGIEWDETRQPLTSSKIAELRSQLKQACEEP